MSLAYVIFFLILLGGTVFIPRTEMGVLLKVENMLSCGFYSNRFMLEHLTKVSNVQDDFFILC